MARERPITDDPKSFVSRRKGTVAVSVGTLITVAGLLLGWGLLPRPSDFAKADVQALRDRGQDEKIEAHEKRIDVVEEEIRQGFKAVLQKLDERKGRR